MTTTRTRRRARTRQAILDAAIDIIMEDGLAALSLREIARRIDYSPAGLYEYFGSKDAIIDAICAEWNDRLIAALHTVPLDLPVDEYLLQIGAAYTAFAHANPDLYVLYTTQFQTETMQHMNAKLHELPSESFGLVFNAVQAGLDAGLFQARDEYGAYEISYAIWGMVHGVAMLRATFLKNVQFDFDSADRATLRVFLDGLKVRNQGQNYP